MNVRWADLDAHTYENMVAVLLSRLHPGSQRIDGRGGDGGRDVQIHQDGQWSFFELKSFSGRVDKARREQIRRSLRKAASLSPRDWTLIVPIDPTPGELEWFDGLQSTVSFPISWNGRTWLDSQIASYPEIHRYYVEGAAEEVLQHLRELSAEQAALSTVTDALNRAEALHQKLNRIDPHFSYGFAVGSDHSVIPSGAILIATIGDTTIYMKERYQGALRDRPISAHVTFTFSDQEAHLREQLERAIDFGESASLPAAMIELDAPGGLGGSYPGGTIQIGPASPSDGTPEPIYLDLFEDERRLGTIQLITSVKSRGRKGAILDARDATEWLQVSLTLDAESRRADFSLNVEPRPSLPAAALPLLRWLKELRPGRMVKIRWPSGVGGTAYLPEVYPFVDEATVELVEALDLIQRATGVYFPTSFEFSSSEVEGIIAARELLSGNDIRGTWSSLSTVLTLAYPGFDVEAFNDGNGRSMAFESDESLVVHGHQIPLGRVATILHAATIANPQEVERAIATGEADVEFQFIPGSSSELLRRRLEPSASG